MPDQFKNIDHIMRDRLGDAQMEPSADLWANIEGQIDAPSSAVDTSTAEVAKTGGKLAKLKIAGALALIGSAVGIISLVTINKPNDPKPEDITETPVLIPEQEVELIGATTDSPGSIALNEREAIVENTASDASLQPQATDMDDPADVTPAPSPTPTIGDQPEDYVADASVKAGKDTKVTNATPQPAPTTEATAVGVDEMDAIYKPGEEVTLTIKLRNTHETEYINDIKLSETFSEYVDPSSIKDIEVNHGRSAKHKLRKKDGVVEFTVTGSLFPLSKSNKKEQTTLELSYTVKVIKRGSLRQIKGKRNAAVDYLGVE